MMDVLSIKGTRETPEILLNKDKGIFEIKGKSLPEDVKEFYNPVLRWFENYLLNPNQQTVLKVKMDYFNTASSKMILEIFELLQELFDKGNEVAIEWYYMADDEDMEDAGQDYSDLVKIPFKFISSQTVTD
ncbi:MAG: DUF1987 domain-containing protein [Bacteroidales bacterium]|nr:DUF1987 domain-containing protein [Bacteroidales bacterium]